MGNLDNNLDTHTHCKRLHPDWVLGYSTHQSFFLETYAPSPLRRRPKNCHSFIDHLPTSLLGVLWFLSLVSTIVSTRWRVLILVFATLKWLGGWIIVLAFLRQHDHLQEMHPLEINSGWKVFAVVFVNDKETRKKARERHFKIKVSKLPSLSLI